MRGKASTSCFFSASYRITPAYAGKSHYPRRRRNGNEDHPRLCGEKNWEVLTWHKILGSPPPMRGKVYTAVSMPDTVGITPAYAGKSPQSLFDAAQERDHPRLCGEKYGVTTDYLLGRGSPPPMRGKVMILKQKRVNERITPAYAGKRPLYSKLHQVFQDHPRLCGEKR